ncbi:integral membrane protein [Stagonosporopsis vannaccii]|nr:integral membrane protein [Stagonosporopsis vannaccii]
MADTQQAWPNRKHEILGSTISIGVLSTLMLIWRVMYAIMNKRKLLFCDYLLILAGIMNVTTMGLRFKTTAFAQGRHIADPSISKPEDILGYSYYVWVGQVINLMAVAVLKWSICAYLLALKFSKVYTVIVWASIVMVTVFNCILPCMGLLNCVPFEANWNRTVKGYCWYKGHTVLTYAQGVSNIITDIVYVVAPILYLSTIQLARRTQWGLRIVFLLGLLATVCSIFKTIELSALKKTKDPTWDGVNLTIWSATELSVGILIASLPPLRKVFDKMFRNILPSTFMTKSKTPGSIPLYNVSKPYSRPMGHSAVEDDMDSEKDILPSQGAGSGITKTVVHEVTSAERSDGVQSPNRAYSTYGKIDG